jgi:hypothetical protein
MKNRDRHESPSAKGIATRLCWSHWRIVDRLTFGGTILETGTDSYRLAQATKQRNT